jgi:hypothetical protein
MDDGDLKSLIEQELAEYPKLDPEDVEVVVSNGQVTLEGRVGTELEFQAVEHVVTDLLGNKDVRNDMLVDELRRGEQSEAADYAAGDRAGNVRERRLLAGADLDLGGDELADEVLLDGGAARGGLHVLEPVREVERRRIEDRELLLDGDGEVRGRLELRTRLCDQLVRCDALFVTHCGAQQ